MLESLRSDIFYGAHPVITLQSLRPGGLRSNAIPSAGEGQEEIEERNLLSKFLLSHPPLALNMNRNRHGIVMLHARVRLS